MSALILPASMETIGPDDEHLIPRSVQLAIDMLLVAVDREVLHVARREMNDSDASAYDLMIPMQNGTSIAVATVIPRPATTPQTTGQEKPDSDEDDGTASV